MDESKSDESSELESSDEDIYTNAVGRLKGTNYSFFSVKMI